VHYCNIMQYVIRIFILHFIFIYTAPELTVIAVVAQEGVATHDALVNKSCCCRTKRNDILHAIRQSLKIPVHKQNNRAISAACCIRLNK